MKNNLFSVRWQRNVGIYNHSDRKRFILSDQTKPRKPRKRLGCFHFNGNDPANTAPLWNPINNQIWTLFEMNVNKSFRFCLVVWSFDALRKTQVGSDIAALILLPSWLLSSRLNGDGSGQRRFDLQPWVGSPPPSRCWCVLAGEKSHQILPRS